MNPEESTVRMTKKQEKARKKKSVFAGADCQV